MSKVWLLASKVLSALLALAQAVWAGEKGGMVNCAPFISERRKYIERYWEYYLVVWYLTMPNFLWEITSYVIGFTLIPNVFTKPLDWSTLQEQ